ncbi:MAG: GIY-YIG nuclease family protein [Ignavibacteriaceae bacterium]
MKYFVYILQSDKDKQFYVGFTTDLKKRLEQHNHGKAKSTRFRRPLRLVYCEIGLDLSDALHREKYLKTSYGKRYIKNRLKNYLKK